MNIFWFQLGIDPFPDWFMDKIGENKVTVYPNVKTEGCIDENIQIVIHESNNKIADFGDFIILDENGKCFAV